MFLFRVYSHFEDNVILISTPAFTFAASNIDHTGCSDTNCYSSSSEDNSLIEFSSTPNTSVQSTPDSSPSENMSSVRVSNEIIMDEPFPENPTPMVLGIVTMSKTSKGKDLSLLKPPGKGYKTPSESLYFREQKLVRKKTTQKDNPHKLALIAKQQHKNIPMRQL